MSAEARLLVRDGDLGRGGGGERAKAWPRTPTRKTQEAVDLCQNNQNVTAVFPRHCVAASVLRSCCLNSCMEQQSHKDNVRSTAVESMINVWIVNL